MCNGEACGVSSCFLTYWTGAPLYQNGSMVTVTKDLVRNRVTRIGSFSSWKSLMTRGIEFGGVRHCQFLRTTCYAIELTL